MAVKRNVTIFETRRFLPAAGGIPWLASLGPRFRSIHPPAVAIKTYNEHPWKIAQAIAERN